MELEKDKEYILDKKFRNSSKVKVVRVYGKHFCRVLHEESGDEWDTMCNRLSPLSDNDNHNK